MTVSKLSEHLQHMRDLMVRIVAYPTTTQGLAWHYRSGCSQLDEAWYPALCSKFLSKACSDAQHTVAPQVVVDKP
jgi:hypothetical protein